MRKFFILMSFVVLGVLGVMWGSTREVQAAASSANMIVQAGEVQASQPECWPLDVVVLIDESLSMSRPSGNDPQGYRFIATKEILNLLISNRRAQCPEALHRFGVIVFGDYVSPTVALTPVDILPEDNREEWSRPIVAAIDSIPKYRPQNGTDPELAFRAADRLFMTAPELSLPEGYGPRRQVVILITDGNPEGVNVGKVDNYMRDLTQSLSAASWDKRSVWIVALNAKYLGNQAFDGLTMRQAWSNIATSHQGRLLGEDKYDEQTIPNALGTIIDEEFGQPGEKIQCGDFYVAPYLQSVRFVFSKRLEYQNKPVILSKLDDATGEVLYRYFDGQTDLIAASSQMTFVEDRYRRDGIIEEYTFDLPLPGRWYFTVEGLDEAACRLGVDARQTPRSANVRLVQPAGVVALSENSPYYDEEVSLPLVVRLEAFDGRPIPLPDYPLALKATLHLPGGEIKLPDGTPIPTYTFGRTPEDLWQSDPPYVLAPKVGVYTLDLEGITAYGNPLKEYAVFTTTLSYEVRKLGRLRFEIQSPDMDQSLPCNTIQDRKAIGRPVPVTVQLLDPTGQPGDVDFYLKSDPTKSFTATFLDGGGTPLDTIWLTPAPQGVGILEGTLLENIPNVIGCGAVSVQVTFEGTVDETRFAFPAHTRTVDFIRPQSEGVLVSIVAPTENQRFLLHSNFWSARDPATVVPVALAFTLTALDDQMLSPAEVAKSIQEALYTAELVAPDGDHETLALTLDGNTFRASGGSTMTQEGTYTFVVEANSHVFKEGYIPADEAPVRVSFERYDALWTNPKTFKTVAISSVSLLAFLIGLAIYLRTGAPRGVVEIAELARPTEIVAGPLGLSRGRFPTFKGSGLSNLGIKRLRARKAKKSLEGRRAVHVKIVGLNGDEIFNNILEVDEPVPLPLDRDVEIVYH